MATYAVGKNPNSHGNATCKRSQEFRERMKVVAMGNTHRLGCKHSEETKTLISKAKIGKMVGKDNHEWVGDKVTYNALHTWVRKHLGKAIECVYCGKDHSERRIEWASVSHKAKRDLDDFISLCVNCHRNYDKKVRI